MLKFYFFLKYLNSDICTFLFKYPINISIALLFAASLNVKYTLLE